MDTKKRREMLHKVPMRKLVASIKKDLKRQIRASAAPGKPEEVGFMSIHSIIVHGCSFIK